MSRILVPARRVDAAAPGLRLRTVQPSPISREMAGRLAKRYGYTIEFWLDLGKPAPAAKFTPRLAIASGESIQVLSSGQSLANESGRLKVEVRKLVHMVRNP
jgi:hypothetical protein